MGQPAAISSDRSQRASHGRGRIRTIDRRRRSSRRLAAAERSSVCHTRPMLKSPFALIDGEHPDFGPVEPTARWIRVRFAGQVIADSRRALLLRQYGREQLPAYYFPQSDVRTETLVPSADADPDDEVSWRSVQVGDRSQRTRRGSFVGRLRA